jgi:hypothetical protein
VTSAGAISITFSPSAAQDDLVCYLQRLGCSVQIDQANRLHVRVSYPETVDDEVEAIRDWCAVWASRGKRELIVDPGVRINRS